MSAKRKKTKAEKQKAMAKWKQRIVSLEVPEVINVGTRSNSSQTSDSVIFDQNQVRLVYKDIRTSLIATIFVACMLAGTYVMMRF